MKIFNSMDKLRAAFPGTTIEESQRSIAIDTDIRDAQAAFFVTVQQGASKEFSNLSADDIRLRVRQRMGDVFLEKIQHGETIAYSETVPSNLSNEKAIAVVGEYGEQFARALVIGATVVMWHIHEHIEQKTGDAWKELPTSLKHESFQDGSMTVHTGVDTIIAALSQLTFSKLEGRDDPLSICEQLIDKGLVNREALQVANATIQPDAEDGRVESYRHALVAIGDEDIAFSRRFKLFLDEQKAKRKRIRAEHDGHGYNQNHLRGCPGALQKVEPIQDLPGFEDLKKVEDSAIQMLGRDILRAARIAYAELTSPGQA